MQERRLLRFLDLPKEDQGRHHGWTSWIFDLYMKCNQGVAHFDDATEAHDQWAKLYKEEINRVTLGLVKQASANKGDIVHFSHPPSGSGKDFYDGNKIRLMDGVI